jgi:hypothetical protein
MDATHALSAGMHGDEPAGLQRGMTIATRRPPPARLLSLIATYHNLLRMWAASI